jgi:hypothetical protein
MASSCLPASSTASPTIGPIALISGDELGQMGERLSGLLQDLR